MCPAPKRRQRLARVTSILVFRSGAARIARARTHRFWTRLDKRRCCNSPRHAPRSKADSGTFKCRPFLETLTVFESVLALRFQKAEIRIGPPKHRTWSSDKHPPHLRRNTGLPGVESLSRATRATGGVLMQVRCIRWVPLVSPTCSFGSATTMVLEQWKREKLLENPHDQLVLK